LLQYIDLLLHLLDNLGLFFVVITLFLLEDSVLFCHFVELVHATLVEINVLLDINFVSVHDTPEAI